MPTKSVQVNVWLDEDTAQELRHLAAEQDRSVGSMARVAIKAYLSQQEEASNGS